MHKCRWVDCISLSLFYVELEYNTYSFVASLTSVCFPIYMDMFFVRNFSKYTRNWKPQQTHVYTEMAVEEK